MYAEYQQTEALNAFAKARARGRRQLFSLNPFRRRNQRVLTLEAVLNHAAYGSEAYIGLREVEVRKIIGTENRSHDYSRNFYPLHKRMSANWSKIYSLMDSGKIFDPVKLIEFGGYYFVRDGNHRISVAKYQNREYISAEVVRYNLPFRLPANLHYGNLKLLEEKYRFNQKTGVFQILSDKEFYVRCPATWRWLTTELCKFNRDWFIRRFNRPPHDMEEQVRTWHKNLYQNAIRYIRENSLNYLFPGKLETDIFIELIKLWNSFEQPDSLWLGEIYQLFIKKHSRYQFIRSPLRRLRRKLHAVFMSPDDEYRQFAEISQIEELVPEFRPMRAHKGFYSFLYSQLIHSYAPHLKQYYGRAPYIQELTVDWYNSLYGPAARAYRESTAEKDWPHAYEDYCRHYYREILAGNISIDAAIKQYFQ